MQKKSVLLFIFILIYSQAFSQIKVACIGNSITYGSRIVNREKNSYPAQLGLILGDKYQVENFGVSGATLLNRANKPYTKTKAYRDALNYKADIVIIKLGTNDSKAINRLYLDDFKQNYQELISSFRQENRKVRMLLALPLPAFINDSNFIWDPCIKNTILPVIKKVAREEKTELIDLNTMFLEHSARLPDGVHPDAIGARMIARELYKAITGEKHPNFAIIPAPGVEYRSGAGWIKGNEWHAINEDINKRLDSLKQLDILFVGNSITQAIGGERKLITTQLGRKAADSIFRGLSWANAGISGDRVENIIWRIKTGKYGKSQPKNVVFMLGVNNFPDDSPKDIHAGIIKLIEISSKQFSQSNILLLGPLPAGTEQDSRFREKYHACHKLLKKTAFPENVHYLNIGSLFIMDSGNLNPDYYRNDGIHLKENGYIIWFEALKKHLITL